MKKIIGGYKNFQSVNQTRGHLETENVTNWSYVLMQVPHVILDCHINRFRITRKHFFKKNILMNTRKCVPEILKILNIWWVGIILWSQFMMSCRLHLQHAKKWKVAQLVWRNIFLLMNIYLNVSGEHSVIKISYRSWSIPNSVMIDRSRSITDFLYI